MSNIRNISNIVFPFLNLYAKPDETLWSNPLFHMVWKEIDIEKDLELLKIKDDQIKFERKALSLRNPPSPENLSTWPLFAIREQDYDEFFNNNFNNMLSVLEINWQMYWSQCRPEVITRQFIDAVRAEYHSGIGEFNKWFDRIIEEEKDYYGVQLIPFFGITRAYSIKTKDMMVSAVSLENRFIRYFHVNHQGIMDKKIKEELDEIAGENAKEFSNFDYNDYFLEQTFEILIMEYYKEKYHLKPKKTIRGDTNITQEETIQIQTDVPLITYNGFNSWN